MIRLPAAKMPLASLTCDVWARSMQDDFATHGPASRGRGPTLSNGWGQRGAISFARPLRTMDARSGMVADATSLRAAEAHLQVRDFGEDPGQQAKVERWLKRWRAVHNTLTPRHTPTHRQTTPCHTAIKQLKRSAHHKR